MATVGVMTLKRTHGTRPFEQSIPGWRLLLLSIRQADNYPRQYFTITKYIFGSITESTILWSHVSGTFTFLDSWHTLFFGKVTAGLDEGI